MQSAKRKAPELDDDDEPLKKQPKNIFTQAAENNGKIASPTENEQISLDIDNERFLTLIRPYKYDQQSLFGDLKYEEEQLDEYSGNSRHYPAEIGEIIEYKKEKVKYQVLRKMGFGNFSLAWLALEEDNGQKNFTALKIYKSNYTRTEEELKNLRRVQKFDHIVRLYRCFELDLGGMKHQCAVFEPLGATLLTFLSRINAQNEENVSVGLCIPAIKKIIRHILRGLHYLHTELNLIHADLKPENILSTVTHRSLYLAVNEVIEKKGRGRGMRAVYYHNTPIQNEDATMNVLEDILASIPPSRSSKLAHTEDNMHTVSEEILWDSVRFKIIDLGNAMKKGSKAGECGTFEYRAPENGFGAPLTSAFDIWSVGAIAFELMTNKQLFTSKRHTAPDIVSSIANVCGKLPSRAYSEFSGYYDLQHFTTDDETFYSTFDNLRERLKPVTAFHSDSEIRQFIKFLIFVFELDPARRPTAEECFDHEWLQKH